MEFESLLVDENRFTLKDNPCVCVFKFGKNFRERKGGGSEMGQCEGEKKEWKTWT